MSIWKRFGCFLTGWNYNILQSCSEASHKALKKYTSAFVIMMILWAFIGYCFSDRYLGLPVWGCILSSMVFIVIVVQIERQIILTIGSNNYVKYARILLAILMAIIGSAILDQYIFKEDIERIRISTVQEDVQKALPSRLFSIEKRITNLNTQIDSLEQINLRLHEEVAKMPTITTVEVATKQNVVRQTDGTDKIISTNDVVRKPIPNPRITQISANDSILYRYRAELKELNERTLTTEKELYDELMTHNGFLEELRAIITLITTRVEAFVFYIILFLFFLLLEMLVVLSKTHDDKSDYDRVIEHQLQVRINALKEMNNKS